MRFSFLLILSIFFSCGKPIVHRDTTLPDPAVLHNIVSESDSIDRHDSVFTVIEVRYDTLKPDCPPAVTTTTARVSTVSNRATTHDTVDKPVPTPYPVYDTIYTQREVPVPYSNWKIIGWLFLGLSIGAIIGFMICAVINVGKR